MTDAAMYAVIKLAHRMTSLGSRYMKHPKCIESTGLKDTCKLSKSCS